MVGTLVKLKLKLEATKAVFPPGYFLRVVNESLSVPYMCRIKYNYTLFANDSSPNDLLISVITSCVLGYNSSMPQCP